MQHGGFQPRYHGQGRFHGGRQGGGYQGDRRYGNNQHGHHQGHYQGHQGHYQGHQGGKGKGYGGKGDGKGGKNQRDRPMIRWGVTLGVPEVSDRFTHIGSDFVKATPHWVGNALPFALKQLDPIPAKVGEQLEIPSLNGTPSELLVNVILANVGRKGPHLAFRVTLLMLKERDRPYFYGGYWTPADGDVAAAETLAVTGRRVLQERGIELPAATILEPFLTVEHDRDFGARVVTLLARWPDDAHLDAPRPLVADKAIFQPTTQKLQDLSEWRNHAPRDTFETSLVLQQINEAMSTGCGELMLNAIERKRKYQKDAGEREQKRRKITTEYDEQKKEAEVAHKAKCAETPEDEEAVKNIEAEFAETWADKLEEAKSKANEHANPATKTDETLKLCLGFLEQPRHYLQATVHVNSLRHCYRSLGKNVTRQEEEDTITMQKPEGSVMSYTPLCEVLEEDMMEQEVPKPPAPAGDSEMKGEGGGEEAEKAEGQPEEPVEVKENKCEAKEEEKEVTPEEAKEESVKEEDAKDEEPKEGSGEAEKMDEDPVEPTEEAKEGQEKKNGDSGLTEEGIDAMNYKELQGACKEVGVSAKGKREELKMRLRMSL